MLFEVCGVARRNRFLPGTCRITVSNRDEGRVGERPLLRIRSNDIINFRRKPVSRSLPGNAGLGKSLRLELVFYLERHGCSDCSC